MRLFFGVRIQDRDKNAIERVQNRIKTAYDGKYTMPDNLHITLAFLGEVEPKLLYMLTQIGDLAFSSYGSFCVQASRIGSFKGGAVTYLAIDDSAELTKLHNSLILLLERANMVYTDEGEYSPHVTLRRGRKIPIEYKVDEMTIAVNEICLYESKRVDGVLRYIPIRVWQAEEN